MTVGVQGMKSYQRLSDLIVSAHDQAFDQGKAEVARLLLRALEAEMTAFGGPGAVERRDASELLDRVFDRQAQLDRTPAKTGRGGPDSITD